MSGSQELSSKQIEVLQLAADGLTYADMAEQLNRPKRTVVGRAVRAMQVLGADNIVQAVAMAVRRGLIK